MGHSYGILYGIILLGFLWGIPMAYLLHTFARIVEKYAMMKSMPYICNGILMAYFHAIKYAMAYFPKVPKVCHKHAISMP